MRGGGPNKKHENERLKEVTKFLGGKWQKNSRGERKFGNGEERDRNVFNNSDRR